jgi:hypothetical protein
MSLTAKTIRALELTLPSGIKCTLVQQGKAWNDLAEWRCVSPEKLANESIVTAPQTDGRQAMQGVFAALFGDITGDSGEQLHVVMASANLASELRRTPAGGSGRFGE